MGGQRTDLERLKYIIPDPYGQAVGLVPVVTSFTDERGLPQYLYTLQSVAPGSAQAKIQFQYNGANLGTAGTVDTVNVASSWVNFARASSTVTLTIPTPSGGTTGLTFSTGLGSLTLNGVLGIANGGTGQTTAPNAINALLPSQTGQSGKFLTTNGTVASWGTAGGSSPLTTKGDLYGHSTVDARVPVGANDLPLVADNSAALGVSYKALPIAGGGTGQTTATAAFDALAPTSPTKGDVLVYNGTHWVKHTHGSDGQVIVFDSTQTDGLNNEDSPFVIPQSLSAAILADSPVAYWKCNDAAGSTTMADSSGNSQTLNTSTSLQANGLATSAFIPSQTDKYVSFFSTGATLFATRTGVPIAAPWSGDLTVECAVCLTDTTSTSINSKLILEFIGATGSSGAGNCQFGFGFTQITANVYAWFAFWETGTNLLTTINFNTLLVADARVVWASIVKDSSAKTLSLYINGRLVVAKPYSLDPTGGGGTLFTVMGVSNRTNSASATSPLLGNLGHACLFNSKLSETRIIAHAKAAGLYTG